MQTEQTCRERPCAGNHRSGLIGVGVGVPLDTAWPRTAFPGLQILNGKRSPAPSPLQPSVRLVSGGLGQVPVLSLALRVTLASPSPPGTSVLASGPSTDEPGLRLSEQITPQLGSVAPSGGQIGA